MQKPTVTTRVARAARIAFVIAVGFATAAPLAGQTSNDARRLVVYGDTVYFFGGGPAAHPLNCVAQSRYKRGEPIGFRMTAINPETGRRDRATELVVHITYGGRTVDVPMRDRQNDRQPEREFWIAKWVVPDDAPTGIVRYTVTAKDPQGRTGEFKPFEVENSQLAIVD